MFSIGEYTHLGIHNYRGYPGYPDRLESAKGQGRIVQSTGERVVQRLHEWDRNDVDGIRFYVDCM